MRNPFSTRFTSPGRVPPLDAAGLPIDVDLMIGRLERLGGMAAIVGPHGSGKSTLLVHVATAIERLGGTKALVRLRSCRDVPAAIAAMRVAGPRGTVCIDGWESIGVAARTALRMIARSAGRGLLVTSHRPVGLPVLVRRDTTAGLLRAIVGGLPDADRWLGTVVQADDIDRAFTRSAGNLREALSQLYDLFEARTRGGDGCPPLTAESARESRSGKVPG